MGSKNSKLKQQMRTLCAVLSEEEINFLLTNTHFNRDEIIEWHSGFIVSCYEK